MRNPNDGWPLISISFHPSYDLLSHRFVPHFWFTSWEFSSEQMSCLHSFTVSQGDAVEAILLEHGHGYTKIAEHYKKQRFLRVSIPLSKTMGISKRSNLPSPEHGNLRLLQPDRKETKFINDPLQSAHPFFSLESPTIQLNHLTSDVAQKWLLMGETSGKDNNNKEHLSQPPRSSLNTGDSSRNHAMLPPATAPLLLPSRTSSNELIPFCPSSGQAIIRLPNFQNVNRPTDDDRRANVGSTGVIRASREVKVQHNAKHMNEKKDAHANSLPNHERRNPGATVDMKQHTYVVNVSTTSPAELSSDTTTYNTHQKRNTGNRSGLNSRVGTAESNSTGPIYDPDGCQGRKPAPLNTSRSPLIRRQRRRDDDRRSSNFGNRFFCSFRFAPFKNKVEEGNVKGQSSSLPRADQRMSSTSHWKSAVDPRTGRTYYYHELTRETQWRKPMELASTEERRAMEEKERRQKDFFAAMEANILKSMSQGVVPGTPKEPQSGTVNRRKSKGPPPVTSHNVDERPELIRTISTMDETVLRDIVRRQPSFRSLSHAGSLTPADLEKPRGNFQSICEPLGPVEESTREFTFEDFDNLPDESVRDDSDSEGSVEIAPAGGMSARSTRSHRSQGRKFNESSISGFGLTWEETQALRKLAEITKEMVDAEAEEEMMRTPGGFPSRASAGGTPGWKPMKDNKTPRDLPRELDFDDDSDASASDSYNDSDHKKKQTVSQAANGPSILKGKNSGQRALPRELEFSDSESETTESEQGLTPGGPPRQKSIRIVEEKKSTKKEEVVARPNVTRRNTCGTLYVGSTMSAPDKDATIKVINFG